MGKIIIKYGKLNDQLENILFFNKFSRLNNNFDKLSTLDNINDFSIFGCNKNEKLEDIILPDGFEIIGFDDIYTYVSNNDSDIVKFAYIKDEDYFSSLNCEYECHYLTKYPINKFVSEKEYLLEKVCISTEIEYRNSKDEDKNLTRVLSYAINEGYYGYFSDNNSDVNKNKRYINKIKRYEILKIISNILTRNGIKLDIDESGYPRKDIVPSTFCEYIRNKVDILCQESPNKEGHSMTYSSKE